MPKKFTGENSKAVAARQRKEAIKIEKDDKQRQKVEDEAWKDDDKQKLKKQQKREEQERKRQQLLEKKAEAKIMLEKELDLIKLPTKTAPPSKITRAQIQQDKQKKESSTSVKSLPPRVVIDKELTENFNRVVIEGEHAQTVEEAITILSDSKLENDKHPEKRMKAAYTAFEENNLPKLKAENPTLRLSQLKQILRKEWLKSPENPLNQKY